MTIASEKIREWAIEYENQSPDAILQLAIAQFSPLALSFSGAEDVVLIDMASKLTEQIQVFCLDTGRLHAETYQFLEQVRQHYQINLEVLFPDTAMVQTLVAQKGLYSFYQDGHQECCSIRKVVPLRRQLNTVAAWITGQRKDQNASTRALLPVIQEDTVFSTAQHRLIKFNPLANWTSAQVWEYIRIHKIPYNTLHTRGFISIGCEPCTRPILPHQQEREGRWWWEQTTQKECGLHVATPIKPT